ncbi:helix-turn-helix domain-containing protein [Maribacter sp. 2210JD10-5]|uniref:helix-turn-helix domain-containing protein n=1 Tax=Maribacter sp. 2210JD10-5 TaxID=3386272 RepID=UPI0039BCF402
MKYETKNLLYIQNRRKAIFLFNFPKKLDGFLFLLFLICGLTCGIAQNNTKDNIEFLSKSSFEELNSAYDESKENISLAKSFAHAFLLKAKKEKNDLKKAEGYYMVAENLTNALAYDKALPYLDSAIVACKKNYTNILPAQAHILKANINGAQTNFTIAMDELTIADDYARKTKNIDQQYDIKYFIALLKSSVGEHQQGLSLLSEVVAYHKTKFLKDSTASRWYLQALFAQANQLIALKQPDSSLVYLKKAMAKALQLNDSILYSRMLLSTVKSLNAKSEYQSSIDSLLKYEAILKEKEVRIGTELRIAFWYGNTYFKQGKKEIALPYLKKMDSLAFADSFFVESFRENYEFLITYYKEKKDTEQQLFYINRLLQVDEILDKDEAYLSKKLHNDYDTPNLIREKQQLISKLENEKSTSKIVLILLSIFSVGLIALLLWNYKKQKIYKKRFYKLLEKTETKQESITNNETSGHIAEYSKSIDVPEDIIQDILQQLNTFETTNGFLKADLSLGVLAKEFGTNSKYFSKIINTYKNKSFSHYINDLRVNYAVDALKNNPKFRKYTIKAIANEAGFNTTEAFSKSFYKSTGIYPSFFLKQLDKKYNIT